MIGEYEAYEIAEEEISKKVSKLESPPDFELATSGQLPLKLPGGWRLPFKLLETDVRIRTEPIIVFVDKNGKPEFEWGEKIVDQIDVQTYQDHKLPSLFRVRRHLRTKFPDKKIETSERVLAWPDEKTYQPCWRIGLVENDFYRFTTMVSFGPDKTTIKDTGLKERSRGVVKKWGNWDIGHSRYRKRSGNVTVKLSPISDKKATEEQITDNIRRPLQWLIWVCMDHAASYLSRLGYHRLNQHIIRTDLVETNSTASPRVTRIDNIPAISFSLEGGWANDPSIICHEICHAIWDLLFTRPPKTLDLSNEQFEGIQEGFADYFAATLLALGKQSAKAKEIIIGGMVPKETIEDNGYEDILPRDINGKPPPPSELDRVEEKYGIGKRWANLLWDFRQRIGEAKKADTIIFLSHFKPRVSNDGPVEPMAAYFQSLLKTATYCGNGFSDWEALARHHGVDMP